MSARDPVTEALARILARRARAAARAAEAEQQAAAPARQERAA